MRLIPYAILGLGLLGIAATLAMGGIAVTQADMTSLIDRMGPWGPAAVIGLMIVHSFIPFPAEIVALTAGAMFGVAQGVLLVWIGAMMGAALAFALSRWFGKTVVMRFLPPSQRAALDRWTDRQGAPALLVARFIPLIAFNLINYAAGLTRVRWHVFLWTTGVGILPLTVVMVWLGAHMRTLSWPVTLAISVLGLAVVWGLYRFLRRVRAGR